MSTFKFFLITFFLSWLLWLAPILSSSSIELLFLPGTIIPALVAFFLTYREGGRVAAQSLLGQIFQWKVEMKWYLFALTYMTVAKLSASLLHRAIAGEWPRFNTEQLYLLPLAIVFSMWVQAGEELGWRGYALPRLADRFGLRGASIVLGVIWATWHLPLFFLQGVDKPGQSFPVYVLQVIAISVAMAWLWQRTNGSLLLLMFMHASINNSIGIVPSATSALDTSVFSFDASLMSWLAAGVLWLAAAYFLFDMKKSREDRRLSSETQGA